VHYDLKHDADAEFRPWPHPSPRTGPGVRLVDSPRRSESRRHPLSRARRLGPLLRLRAQVRQWLHAHPLRQRVPGVPTGTS